MSNSKGLIWGAVAVGVGALGYLVYKQLPTVNLGAMIQRCCFNTCTKVVFREGRNLNEQRERHSGMERLRPFLAPFLDERNPDGGGEKLIRQIEDDVGIHTTSRQKSGRERSNSFGDKTSYTVKSGNLQRKPDQFLRIEETQFEEEEGGIFDAEPSPPWVRRELSKYDSVRVLDCGLFPPTQRKLLRLKQRFFEGLAAFGLTVAVAGVTELLQRAIEKCFNNSPSEVGGGEFTVSALAMNALWTLGRNVHWIMAGVTGSVSSVMGLQYLAGHVARGIHSKKTVLSDRSCIYMASLLLAGERRRYYEAADTITRWTNKLDDDFNMIFERIDVVVLYGKYGVMGDRYRRTIIPVSDFERLKTAVMSLKTMEELVFVFRSAKSQMEIYERKIGWQQSLEFDIVWEHNVICYACRALDQFPVFQSTVRENVTY